MKCQIFEFPHSERVLKQFATGTNSTSQGSIKIPEKRKNLTSTTPRKIEDFLQIFLRPKEKLSATRPNIPKIWFFWKQRRLIVITNWSRTSEGRKKDNLKRNSKKEAGIWKKKTPNSPNYDITKKKETILF